jgi:hypothetical protein
LIILDFESSSKSDMRMQICKNFEKKKGHVAVSAIEMQHTNFRIK